MGDALGGAPAALRAVRRHPGGRRHHRPRHRPLQGLRIREPADPHRRRLPPIFFSSRVRAPELAVRAQVTFREPEAARRAVQDPNPTIAGRRANCNIASLGPPRPAQPRGE